MGAGSNALTTDTKSLTLAGCKKIMAAAEAEAKRQDVQLSIAILDAGGHLLHLSRMDGAHAGTAEIAIGKGRCAAVYRRPSREYAELYAGGQTALAILPNMYPMNGGVPIMIDGSCIGAVGVSGATGDIDNQVASAGAGALQA